MIGRIFTALAATGLAALCCGSGEHQIQRDVQQHLALARKCANAGQIQGALAHAAVVTPENRLRVRIDCSDLPRNEQGACRNALSAAFRMWEQALGEQVFEVRETGPVDVVVHFQPTVSDKGLEVCGHARWTRGVLNPDTNPTVVLTADVQVRRLKPNGESLTFEQMRACAAHELGHVLGLDDSSITGDLMGRMDFNRPALTIRQDEIAELVRARGEAERIRRSLSPQASIKK